MPVLTKVQALTANQRGYNPFAGWQYEYAPYRALVRVGLNHTGASGTVQGAAFVGSQNIVERGPLTGGGTAGTLPSPLNVPYIEFVVDPGDRISMLIDETAGATPTVNMFAALDPV
jgi:hypothetical protein